MISDKDLIIDVSFSYELNSMLAKSGCISKTRPIKSNCSKKDFHPPSFPRLLECLCRLSISLLSVKLQIR